MISLLFTISNLVGSSTHVVKKGDTLWDLAFTYLGDPFGWPVVWNANPSVANPDLIYPGDVLQIPGSDRAGALSAPVDSSIAPTAYATLGQKGTLELNSVFTENKALNESLKNEYDDANFDSSLMAGFKKKNPLDESFFAKIPFLWSDRDPAGNIYPGKGVVNKPQNASFQLFDKIIISPQAESYFKTGDTLDIFASVQFVEYQAKTVNIIKRVGKCRVLESAPLKVVAVLFEQWDVIQGQERVDKATVFKAVNADSLYDPQVAITGSVFTRVEQTPSPYPYQTVIVDKGTKDGVELGDIFGIYHLTDKKGAGKLVSVGIVAHVNSLSSSLSLLTLVNNTLEAGDKVVLVRKIRISTISEG